MEWLIILLLAVAALVTLFPVFLAWYVCIGGTCLAVRERRVMSMACFIDADCPPGFHCAGGHCVPNRA